jgi:hypothetical protein
MDELHAEALKEIALEGKKGGEAADCIRHP